MIYDVLVVVIVIIVVLFHFYCNQSTKFTRSCFSIFYLFCFSVSFRSVQTIDLTRLLLLAILFKFLIIFDRIVVKSIKTKQVLKFN